MEEPTLESFTTEQQETLRSIRVSRILLPVLIGVGVVLYLLWRQFDPKEFEQIQWTNRTLFWIAIAALILVIRHLAYAWRLRILSEGAFSWRKCIELIFIWEFSSAVSPTSVGGSAVAFLVLAQEKLPTAKTTTMVLYTLILDAAFFVLLTPLLLLIYGTTIIRPDMHQLSDISGWGYVFFISFAFMALYGGFFAYGLFVSPEKLKRSLHWLSRRKWFSRYKKRLEKLGEDMLVASRELARQNWPFHIKAFTATAIAWAGRFFSLNAIIIALVTTVPVALGFQFELFARLVAMFLVLFLSPTPGGAGIIEILFNGFLSDYLLNPTFSTIIATLWRLMTYYVYLLAGVVIVPNWIRKIVNEKKSRKSTQYSKVNRSAG